MQFILSSGGNRRSASESVVIYYLHIVLDPAVRIGATLTADNASVKLASWHRSDVINESKNVAFINPLRYPERPHGDALLPQGTTARVVSTTACSESARIRWTLRLDEAGKLVGNWFLEGTPVSESANPTAWSRHLASSSTTDDPSRMRVAIGGSPPVIGALPSPETDPTHEPSPRVRQSDLSSADAWRGW